MYRYTLSVVVPTYNRRELLEFTLSSLARQDISRERFEVIVVDDGSDDDTREAVNRYSDYLNLKHRFQENTGYRPGSARNLGIVNAEGEVCLFLDSGVVLQSSCLREHIVMHANAAYRIAVLGYVYGFDQDGSGEDQIGKIIVPAEPDITIDRFKAVGTGFDIRDKYYQKYNDKLEDLPAPWVFFWTCNVSVQRKELIKIGLFDSNYDGKWGCEDNDLGLRLWNDGVKISLCRGAESIHLPHGKNMELKLSQGYANCEYLNKKFGTYATAAFLENYKQIVMNESVDINELITQMQSAGQIA